MNILQLSRWENLFAQISLHFLFPSHRVFLWCWNVALFVTSNKYKFRFTHISNATYRIIQSYQTKFENIFPFIYIYRTNLSWANTQRYSNDVANIWTLNAKHLRDTYRTINRLFAYCTWICLHSSGSMLWNGKISAWVIWRIVKK